MGKGKCTTASSLLNSASKLQQMEQVEQELASTKLLLKAAHEQEAAQLAKEAEGAKGLQQEKKEEGAKGGQPPQPADAGVPKEGEKKEGEGEEKGKGQEAERAADGEGEVIGAELPTPM